MSGVRGSYWFLLDRRIVFEKTENADSNMEKNMNIDDPKIDLEASRGHLGVTRDIRE